MLSLSKTKNRDLQVFLALLVLVLLLRTPSFFISVFNWDESSYFLIAKDMLQGKMLYVDLWDHKPPGIYVLNALGQMVFGHSILSIRLLACIAAVSTSFLLYLMAKTLFKRDDRLSALAGVLYAIFSLLNGGYGSNTEIIFTPFVVLGFYLLVSYTNGLDGSGANKIKLFAGGLSFGMALQINAVNVFVFLAALGFLGRRLCSVSKSGKQGFIGEWWEAALWLGLGPLLFYEAAFLYFWLHGHLFEYVYANFVSPLIYVGQFKHLFFSNAWMMLKIQISHNLMLWAPAFLMPLYLSKENEKSVVFLWVWFWAALLGILSTSEPYHHYFQEMVAPLCLINTFLFFYILDQTKALGLKVRAVVIILIFGSALIPVAHSLEYTRDLVFHRFYKNDKYWGDTPAAIAASIRPLIKPGEYIYVVDYEPIIYHLTGVGVPSKYAYCPWFLYSRYFSKLVFRDPLMELDSIILVKKPEFIITRGRWKRSSRDPRFYKRLEDYLLRYYGPPLKFHTEQVGINLNKTRFDALVYRLKG